MLNTRLWGTTTDGTPVRAHTLSADSGFAITIVDLGATVVSTMQPDAGGNIEEVSLSHRNVAETEEARSFLGGTIGRYANRIAGAAFELDGNTHRLDANDRGNCLHGGSQGFFAKIWRPEVTDNSVTFHHTSPHGDQGFPGSVSAAVTFALSVTDDGADQLAMSFRATTDAPTVVNLTNHTYFNLAGLKTAGGPQTIHDHVLRIDAEEVLAVDALGLPIGVLSVQDTPFDLRKPVSLGERTADPHDQIAQFGGFDHTYVLHNKPARPEPVPACELTHPGSGRRLRIATTKPGVQVYTGNWMHEPWGPHAGIALETQHWPDSPNRSAYPSSVLRPGEIYSHSTTWSFDSSS